MNKKVYIIGAVTGLEREAVVAKFDKAAQALNSAGMAPVNPVEVVQPETGWNDAMRLCIKTMLTCDAVLLLPDWQESRGATLEVMIARNLEMPEFSQSLKKSKIW
ncbi:MAG: DUF4406 domain-containing protein [Lentimicrobium sp.]|jgi:hypothetical protein|nr:DUF4406 domain-containing protein [Lentimicrobium sp.]